MLKPWDMKPGVETKMCPVLTRYLKVAHCIEEGCAWWIGTDQTAWGCGHCSICELAKLIGGIFDKMPSASL